MASQTTVFSLEADRIDRQIREQRDQLRRNPADRLLELAIEADEERVRILRRDHAAAVKRAQDREAAAQAREQADRAALEARLMSEYRAAAPGTTEEDARAALPDLLHRHRLAQLDQHDAALETARRRIRF